MTTRAAVAPIDCSIVVCTYNNADSLRLTLDSLAKLRIAGLSVEAIVVENNCGDHTADIVAAWSPPFPKSHLKEPQQGLSWARNTGMAAARGAFVAFTDDDVSVDPDWITELARAFRETGCAAAGGRVLPRWGAPMPRWLTSDLYGFLALLDLGDEPLALSEPNLYGANFAIRGDVRERHVFGNEVGKTGSNLAGIEDTEMLRAVLNDGGTLTYWPSAIVHHRIAPSRMTKAYFRRWHRHLGQMQGRLAPAVIPRALFGVPYYVYRGTMASGARLIFKTLSAQNGFVDELNLMRLVGFAEVRLRRRARRTESPHCPAASQH